MTAAVAEFTGRGPVDSPAWDAGPVTPSDTVDLLFQSRGLYVGGTGDVVVNMAGPDSTNPVTFKAVPAGVLLPIRVTRVLAVGSGTTATNITAIW